MHAGETAAAPAPSPITRPLTHSRCRCRSPCRKCRLSSKMTARITWRPRRLAHSRRRRRSYSLRSNCRPPSMVMAPLTPGRRCRRRSSRAQTRTMDRGPRVKAFLSAVSLSRPSAALPPSSFRRPCTALPPSSFRRPFRRPPAALAPSSHRCPLLQGPSPQGSRPAPPAAAEAAAEAQVIEAIAIDVVHDCFMDCGQCHSHDLTSRLTPT